MENYPNLNTGIAAPAVYGFGNLGQSVTGIGSADLSNMNQAKSAKSPSVIEQLNHQEKALSGLHLMLDQLADRLAVILGPTPPSAGAGSSPTPVASQLSQRIPMHTRSIEAVGQRIAEIINRVEL